MQIKIDNKFAAKYDLFSNYREYSEVKWFVLKLNKGYRLNEQNNSKCKMNKTGASGAEPPTSLENFN